MAKFFVFHTVKKEDDLADFYVEFLESQLQIGDEFITYDTHHQVKWKIIEIRAIEGKFIAVCSTPHGLGINNQFAGAMVNTEGANRLELFRYDHTRDKEVFD
jgi:hypothetical protein